MSYVNKLIFSLHPKYKSHLVMAVNGANCNSDGPCVTKVTKSQAIKPGSES